MWRYSYGEVALPSLLCSFQFPLVENPPENAGVIVETYWHVFMAHIVCTEPHYTDKLCKKIIYARIWYVGGPTGRLFFSSRTKIARPYTASVPYVDHDILLQRLEVAFGLKDTVLDWVRSSVTGRTQQVTYVVVCRRCGAYCVLLGVPQGSVLGPVLYVLYTAQLSQVVARHGLRLHMYAAHWHNNRGCTTVGLTSSLHVSHMSTHR